MAPKRTSQMKPFFVSLLALVVLPLMGAAPDGKTIANNGNGNGAMSCNACHGNHFQGNPALHAPVLAGRPAAFILARLAHYKSPAGRNAMMKQEASSLTPGESQAVAAYLASLPKT